MQGLTEIKVAVNAEIVFDVAIVNEIGDEIAHADAIQTDSGGKNSALAGVGIDLLDFDGANARRHILLAQAVAQRGNSFMATENREGHAREDVVARAKLM